MSTVNCHWSCLPWLLQSSSSPGKAQISTPGNANRKCKGEKILRQTYPASDLKYSSLVTAPEVYWVLPIYLTDDAAFKPLTVSEVGFALYPSYKPINQAFFGQSQASSTGETELDPWLCVCVVHICCAVESMRLALQRLEAHESSL